MIHTIIAALLPIIVTLILGFFAGWHHDFNITQGTTLNRMVMLYALPLMLFSGMLSMSRQEILSQGGIAILLLIGMVLCYIIVLFLSFYFFKINLKKSSLLALAIAGPAVPFVGVPVLGFLYGDISTVPIAISSLILNLFQVPITLYILGQNNSEKNGNNSILVNIKKTIKEPVVWAPILAFILLLLNFKIPIIFQSSLKLLGEATGGVALFASGVILYSYNITFNKTILISVLSKNIIFPFIMLITGTLLHITKNSLNISIITLSIPSASICVIFAVQYKTAAKEMASILFFSTVLSVITMGCFLLYLK